MGHYANFNITAEDNGETITDQVIKRAIAEASGYDEHIEIDSARCWILDDVSWHNYTDHMRAVSKQFPNVLFTVERSGSEGCEDESTAWFQNGKMQWERLQCFTPLFDQAKLDADQGDTDLVPVPKEIYDRLVEALDNGLHLLGEYYPTDDDISVLGSTKEDQEHHEKVSQELDKLLLTLRTLK